MKGSQRSDQPPVLLIRLSKRTLRCSDMVAAAVRTSGT